MIGAVLVLIGFLSMSDVPIYQQNWTAGTPAFVADTVYDRPGGDPADPLYPELAYGEGVTINGSNHADSGHSYNYFLSSIWLGYGDYPFPGAPLVVNEGYIQCRYKPNATSLAAGGGDSDILYVYRGSSGNNDLAFSVARNMPGNTLVFDAWNAANTINSNATPSFTAVAGTEYLFRVEFKVGTGGYIRLKVNGTTLYEDLAFEPWFAGVSGNQIDNMLFGGWALFGELWEIEIGTFSQTVQAYVFGRGAAADDKATVVSDLTVLVNLDGLGRTVDEPNTLYVAGDVIVTGTTTFAGMSFSDPTSILDALVSTDDGQAVIDSDGNVVFVNGS